MKHSEMVKKLCKSGEVISQELTPSDCHIIHMVMGISGEATELLEALDTSPLDVDHIIEELGELEFYLEGLRQGLSITRKEVLQKSIMDIDELKKALSRSISPRDEGNLGIGVSLVCHAGNLLDYIKKHVIYRKPLDIDKVITSMGYLELMLDGIRNIIIVSRTVVLESNIKKLGKRYHGHSYSDKQAQERADKNSVEQMGFDEWYRATKDHGGSREEYDKLVSFGRLTVNP